MNFSPAQLVNPYIGTISHLLKSTRAEVYLPHCHPKSMLLFEENSDYYCNDIVRGFPIGLAHVMPGCGKAACAEDFLNTVDHSRVEAHPYYSRVELEENDIVAEMTTTTHAFVYRFTNAPRLAIVFPENSDVRLKDGKIYIHLKCENKQRQMEEQYIVLSASCAFAQVSLSEKLMVIEHAESGVELCGALSFISFEKALEIHAKEIEGKGFDEISKASLEAWDALLSKIKVSGENKDQMIAFYTALYRAAQRMVECAEYGAYYSGYDKSVHQGESFYTNDNTWDTFRCMHPLQLLIEPKRHKDILESYNLMYRQSGLMPSVPESGGDRPVMLGFHAASLFADALAKGQDVDFETAYEGIYKNATEQCMLPWVCDTKHTVLDECYAEKGFFPALKPDEKETIPQAHSFERRQAVAVTLEHCYDDWCAAQIAKALGKQADYEAFMKRAENYKTLYDPEKGIMAPRAMDGSWVEMDPMWGGGVGGRDYYAENNAYTYTWSVFHDIQGLKALMGGDEAMAKKLDELFTLGVSKNGRLTNKYVLLAQFPDATGLMGQFAMGNEPSFHIPYLYNDCGQPWKTQKRIREQMDIWFTNSPTGICGDEDGGAMSSFFVFSAMGFYPVCPGSDAYSIGSPLFDSVELDVEDGKKFTIRAEGASKGLRYIQSATLNGKALDVPVLKHGDIVAGGELVFEMGARPNRAWGTAAR